MEPLPASELSSGSVVADRYEIIGALQCGASDTVYRVVDHRTGAEVALKTFAWGDDDGHRSLRIHQDFRALIRLRHPRLVEVYDCGLTEGGAPFFTMELPSGPPLSSVLPLIPHDVLRVLVSIADVLAFMHVRGYAHRRVRTDNVCVLLSRTANPMQIKLLEPGLDGPRWSQSAQDEICCYLPPEARHGETPQTRCDLYGLGVLVYEAAVGSLPFRGESAAEIFESKQHPVDLHELRPAIPVPLSHLVRDLLAPEPSNRPGSAIEVLGRIRELAESVTYFDSEIVLRAPELVGRQRELDAVLAAQQLRESDEPVSLMLRGTAGQGKTRLCEEALIEMRLGGALVASSRGHGFGAVPFAVLRDLLTSLLTSPCAEQALAASGSRGPLEPLTSKSGLQTEAASNADALHQALIRLLDCLTQDVPVVVSIDDIHLADDASVEALAAVLSSGAACRLTIIGTYRTEEPVRPSLQFLLKSSAGLELEPLTPKAIAALIRKTLGAQPEAPLVEDIHRYSGGNAYLVLEVLRDAIARGIIVRRRSGVELPENLGAVGVPHGLTDALQRRLARLSPAALQVARVVAVIGRRTPYGMARSLSDLGRDAFLDAIDELRRAEVIDVTGEQLDLHHARLRDVLYRGIEPSVRRDLHGRVAHALEAELGEEHLEHAGFLGHHFEAAGHYTEALRYLVVSADRLYDRHALDDAGEVFKRAEGLLDAAPKEAQTELACRLSDRMGRVGFRFDHRGATPYLEQARQLHLQHGLLWTIPVLHRLVGPIVANTIGITSTVLWNVVRLRPNPIGTAKEHLIGAFAAGSYLSNCYSYAGSFARALEAAESLRPFICSSRGLPKAGHLIATAPALVFVGELDAAAEACERALDILKRQIDPALTEHDRVVATAGALTTRMWCDLYRGHTTQSPWRDRLADYVRTNPTPLLDAWLMEGDVYLGFRLGQLEASREAWQRLARKAQLAEVQFVQGKARTWLGMACLQAGKTTEAMDLADTLIDHATSDNNRMLQILGLLLRGSVLHTWGHLPDAHAALEEAAQVATEPEVQCRLLGDWVALAQADVDIARGAPEQAELRAQSVRKSASSPGRDHPLHRMRANHILARVVALRGQPRQAERYLGEAREIATQLDDRLELQRCANVDENR
jgi:tetratricopeptide (TPR) repeat protein